MGLYVAHNNLVVMAILGVHDQQNGDFIKRGRPKSPISWSAARMVRPVNTSSTNTIFLASA